MGADFEDCCEVAGRSQPLTGVRFAVGERLPELLLRRTLIVAVGPSRRYVIRTDGSGA